LCPFHISARRVGFIAARDENQADHQLPGAALVRYRKHRTNMRSGLCGYPALRLPHGQIVMREPFERDVAPYLRPERLMKNRS